MLGDAYEDLMRHFAVESGKSKGQFLTPAEVSRVKAQVLQIDSDDVKAMERNSLPCWIPSSPTGKSGGGS
ncbi:MAG: N-6 DNA methylase [Cyanobium sp.]